MSSVNYTPVPSVTPFILSDKFQSFIVGPLGSTKTTAALMKIPYEAKRMAKSKDGIRHSRCVIVRNTRQTLLDSTIKDFLALFPEGQAGVYMRTELKFLLKFDDVECEVLFRGLDDANDTKRLLSLQISFGFCDEIREINPDIFAALTGRLGRYPNGMMVPNRPEWGNDEKGNPIQGCVDDAGRQMKKIWGATNPADADSYWENYLTSAEPDKVHVTIQPSGRSPKADWVQHLPANYYEDLMVGKSEDWISVYVDGKWGRSLAGKPVFTSFVPDFHVAAEPLMPILNGLRPLLIGMDFGLNPSAVLCQLDARGRFLVYESLTSDGMGILRFIQSMLKPALAERYPGAPVLVIGDPAGTARVQTDERTVYDILKQEGFKAVPAHTNSIAARITAVDQFLARQIDGGPGFLIDPRARRLITALRSKYRYRMKTNGEMEDKPEKNDASHEIDALQYGALHADAQQGGHLDRRKAHVIEDVSMAAWV
jgi:hypothetical protein